MVSFEYEEKLRSLGLSDDVNVTLTCTDGCDVFIHNDTAIDTALKETDVVKMFSKLVEHLAKGSNKTHWILEELRDDWVLDFDDSEDDEGNQVPVRLDSHDIALAVNSSFGDQRFIESEIKRYDHKRGRCDLTACVEMSLRELLGSLPDLSGWDIIVQTSHGELRISG